MADGDAKASAQFAVRGVMPARQARSEATFQALVDAGRRVIETKTFDQMTIGDVAQAAGASVGSFYARFEDKETFFAFIQQTAMAEVESRLQECLDGWVADINDDALLRSLSSFWVDIYRTNRGLYRASFKHSSTRPDAWEPFKRTGRKAATMIYQKLKPSFDRSGRKLNEQDLRVALQFANGMLINAVINDPGPISIDDPQMREYVARLLSSFLGLSADKPRGAPVRRIKHKSRKA